jgi:hypothetical protein
MKRVHTPVVLFFVGLLFSAQPLFSQRRLLDAVQTYSNAQQFMEDVLGRPIYQKVEYNIEGTPFYPAEYYKANIVLLSGRVYSDVYVKFNLLENLVLFKLPDGSENSATTAIRKIFFTDTSNGGAMLNVTFENGFAPIDKLSEETFYEVLELGQAKLLKHHKVVYNDKRYYGQASYTRIFDQYETYYVCLPGNDMKKIEKGKEALLSLFADKKTELKGFIEKNRLKCRNENDWKKVIAFYNSLFRDA